LTGSSGKTLHHVNILHIVVYAQMFQKPSKGRRLQLNLRLFIVFHDHSRSAFDSGLWPAYQCPQALIHT
jgi:hypothetical protein